MMGSNLPPLVRKRDAVRAFQRAGWVEVSQKGTHLQLCKDGAYITLVGGDNREMNLGSLRTALQNAGMSAGEFRQLLKEK